MRLPCCTFLQIRTIVDSIGSVDGCRTDEIFFPPHRAYQTLTEKQTGRQAGAQAPGRRCGRFLPRSRRYTRLSVWSPENLSRPIVYRQERRHRTYSTEVTSCPEQSPASSHTCFGHIPPTRLLRITKFPLAVKREFCIFYRFFSVIFVQIAYCGLGLVPAQNMGLLSRRWTARRSA